MEDMKNFPMRKRWVLIGGDYHLYPADSFPPIISLITTLGIFIIAAFNGRINFESIGLCLVFLFASAFFVFINSKELSSFRYEIGEEHITLYQNVMAAKNVQQIPYRYFTKVSVFQNLFDRIFGLATVWVNLDKDAYDDFLKPFSNAGRRTGSANGIGVYGGLAGVAQKTVVILIQGLSKKDAESLKEILTEKAKLS